MFERSRVRTWQINKLHSTQFELLYFDGAIQFRCWRDTTSMLGRRNLGRQDDGATQPTFVTKIRFTRVCMGTLRVCFKYLKFNVLRIKLTCLAFLSYSLLFHAGKRAIFRPLRWDSVNRRPTYWEAIYPRFSWSWFERLRPFLGSILASQYDDSILSQAAFFLDWDTKPELTPWKRFKTASNTVKQ